jgi:hypothetical protein
MKAEAGFSQTFSYPRLKNNHKELQKMPEIIKILSDAGIGVSESGRCGRIKDLEIRFYAVAGEDCIRAWKTLSEKADRTIIAVPENINEGNIISDNSGEIEKDLRSYPALDLQKWLQERWGVYDFENEEDELEEIMEEAGGEVPEPQPCHHFTIPYKILSETGQAHEKMWLLDFTGIPRHEIPVYMQYGGWNACPYPDEQAAVLKHWHEKYGAGLFGLTHDTVELYVKNPPTDYEQAHILAKEQMAYCDDIVFQGTMTVERLARVLISSSSWYFWWD